MRRPPPNAPTWFLVVCLQLVTIVGALLVGGTIILFEIARPGLWHRTLGAAIDIALVGAIAFLAAGVVSTLLAGAREINKRAREEEGELQEDSNANR